MDSRDNIIKIIRNCLAAKEVIIFGAGDIAVNFYLEFKDMLNITGCVSNIPKEWGEKNFCDELDIVKYDKKLFSDSTYIILCGEYIFKTVSQQLDADGLHMFTDYNDYQIVKAVLADKKIALFRGSCVLRDALESLKKVRVFFNQYVAIFVQDKQASTKYENPLLLYAAQICDYYIYSYRMMSTEPVFMLQSDELAEECKYFSVSNQSFSGYWPQADPDITHRNPYWIYSYNNKRDRLFYHNMFLYTDVFINKLIEAGCDKEEIIDLVCSDDFMDEKTIDKTVRRAIKAMQIADRGADIKMADFIEENYLERRVYQNFDHLDKCVIWEYVRRILRRMDLDVEECYELERKSPRYNHNGSDIPIYPCVIKHLGLTWITKDSKYEIVFYDKILNLTFREYIEKYIDYVMVSREIMREW